MPYLKKAPKIRTNTPNRTNRQKVYLSAKWKKLRESKLMVNPLCELCLLEDRVTPAEDVHHIISPFKFNGEERDKYAYDFCNLMSLCKKCHSNIHGLHKEESLYHIYYENKRN